MEMIHVVETEKPKLKDPMFVEGLPGVGNVGKLAAEHLIDELNAKKFASVFCTDFPPQVFVNADGTVKLVNNEMYYVKAGKKSKNDLILLTGDYQGLTSQGQYQLTDRVLDVLAHHKVRTIFTLGGYGLGRMVSEPAVLGAATDKKLVEKMKKHGVQFREDEPGGGIVGASGLFLGLGMLRGIGGVCLMGETSGYLVDPKSARAVLEVLSKVLEVKIGFEELEEKAKEMDRIATQLRDMERRGAEKPSEELRYIG